MILSHLFFLMIIHLFFLMIDYPNPFCIQDLILVLLMILIMNLIILMIIHFFKTSMSLLQISQCYNCLLTRNPSLFWLSFTSVIHLLIVKIFFMLSVCQKILLKFIYLQILIFYCPVQSFAVILFGNFLGLLMYFHLMIPSVLLSDNSGLAFKYSLTCPVSFLCLLFLKKIFESFCLSS